MTFRFEIIPCFISAQSVLIIIDDVLKKTFTLFLKNNEISQTISTKKNRERIHDHLLSPRDQRILGKLTYEISQLRQYSFLQHVYRLYFIPLA